MTISILLCFIDLLSWGYALIPSHLCTSYVQLNIESTLLNRKVWSPLRSYYIHSKSNRNWTLSAEREVDFYRPICKILKGIARKKQQQQQQKIADSWGFDHRCNAFLSFHSSCIAISVCLRQKIYITLYNWIMWIR